MPKTVREIIAFHKKNKRAPTQREIHKILLPIMAKTRFFRKQESNFEQTVGMIVITWAIIEHTVNLVNAVAVTRAGGKELARFLPQSLKPKLALFKHSFKRLEALAAFRDRALAIHDELNTLKEFRHDFTHGIVSQKFVSARRILRHSYSGSMLLPHYRTYTGSEMRHKLLKLYALRNRLRRLLTDIDAALPKDMIDNARR